MFQAKNVMNSVRGERTTSALPLALVVFLWQAAVGIYFLSLVQQYLPQALNASLAYPGYALATYGGAKFIWQPIAGWVADRVGRRVTMLTGMAFSVPVLALMMEVPDERAFLAFSALLGLGAATMWPAFMAHVGECTPRDRRSRTMTLINLAQMAGLGIGTLGGVLMVDFVTYAGAFWLCIVFSVLAIVMVMRTIGSAVHHEQPIPVPVQSEGAAAQESHGWTPGVLALGVIVVFLTLGTSMHTPMIGAYTSEVLKVKMSYLAMLFPGPAIVAAIAMWKLHKVTDRFPRHVPLVGGLLVAALSIFALTLTRNPFIVVNLTVLAGLAYAISIPAWGAAALDATDVGSRGLWLGALTAVQGLGAAGGQALGGVIGGIWGPLAPFKIAALLLVVAMTLIVIHQTVHSRKRRGSLPAPAALPVPAD